MTRCPLLLDAVGFLDFEQAFADHGDHQILCRENAESGIDCGVRGEWRGDRLLPGCSSNVNGEGDRRTFARPQAPRGEQGSEELKLFRSAHARLRNEAGVESCSEPLLLLRIAVADFRRDMVGGEKNVGVAGDQVCPVDAAEN